MAIDIDYTYNASSTVNGPFGYGRTLSPNMLAQASGSPTIVTLTRGSGALASYQDDGSGRFQPQTPGLMNSLVKDTTNSFPPASSFQFHTGSIKGFGGVKVRRRRPRSFNSTLVRLKGTGSGGLATHPI